MASLTIFSWGYDGWGNATDGLVRAVDAVERSRGFKPPLFVDIRIRRGARAVGFRERAFEEKVGFDRYLWMNDLGNEAIETGVSGIVIKNPRAAEILLTLAIENIKRPRRIIFFCSCGWPVYPDGTCHRVPVAQLLIRAAARRGVAVDVVEWPGGSVKRVERHLSAEDFRKARTGATIQLGDDLPPTELLSLPYASLLTVRDQDQSASYFVAPAQFWGGRWVLPKLTDGLEKNSSKERGLEAGRQWRKRWGFEPRNVGT